MQWSSANKCFVYLLWMFVTVKFNHLHNDEVLKFLRVKLRSHYLAFFKDTHNLFKDKADLIFQLIPFLFGYSIKQLICKCIRYGSDLLAIGDPQSVQLYQFVFYELMGFHADSIYITKQLNVLLQKKVQLKFIESQHDFSPIRNNLKELVGPSTLHRSVSMLIQMSHPSKNQLQHLVCFDLMQFRSNPVEYKQPRLPVVIKNRYEP